jgi:hypothetical protein
MKTKTSWKAKLEKPAQAEVKPTPKGRMLIPRPIDIDALMKQVPRGRLVTTEQIRERLARDSGADYTCPMCTGIFVRIAAEAAAETIEEGGKAATPFWRTIKADGSLNEKYPGGIANQARLLEQDGHTVVPGKGKKPPRVADFEKHLVEL